MGYSMGASGTLRDPLDATRDSDGDASDEISDVSSSDGHTANADEKSASSAAQPASKKSELQMNQFETPLGLDPSSTPDFVQHVASFKAQLELVQDKVKNMRTAQHSGDMSQVTAQAADEEECIRAVVDLREFAKKLDKHQFQEKAQLLDQVENKACFVTVTKFHTYFISGGNGRWTRLGLECSCGGGDSRAIPKVCFAALKKIQCC